MEFVLYNMEDCPFCKHFRRIFRNTVPEGKMVILDGHTDPRWIEHRIDFVPTVIAYEDGVEVDRIGSVKMVGIRYERWVEWLKKVMGEHSS